MATKVTLPKLSQLETPYVTDREISTGAWVKRRKVNGQEVNAGVVFSSVAEDTDSVQVRGCDGAVGACAAGEGHPVVRLRLEKEDPSKTSFGSVICINFEVRNGILLAEGNPVYWGAEKIDVVEELGNINLKLPSDKNGNNNWAKYSNKPFELQENQCVKVKLADGTTVFAEKIVGVKQINVDSTYSDETQVKNGATVYHRLRPMPAKEIDGGIQTCAGMATKFDTQYHFTGKKHRNGDALKIANIEDYDVGKAINAMTTAFVKSAKLMAKLTNTVSGLFDQLLDGIIDEEGLRAGLKAITKQAQEKEGSTVEDAQNLAEEIKQVSTMYATKKAEREKKRREDVNSAFTKVNNKIDQLKI